MDHEPDRCFLQALADIFQTIHKSGGNTLPDGLLFHRCIDLYLINIKVYGTVVNPVIIAAKLGFHAFQLVSDIRQTLFDGNNIFHTLCLLQKL